MSKFNSETGAKKQRPKGQFWARGRNFPQRPFRLGPTSLSTCIYQTDAACPSQSYSCLGPGSAQGGGLRLIQVNRTSERMEPSSKSRLRIVAGGASKPFLHVIERVFVHERDG